MDDEVQMVVKGGVAMPLVTRFAPSPTGWLHLGHAFAALFAHRAAEKVGGRFLVRLEDIDGSRVRPEYELALREDLLWLGLHWEEPMRKQSEHFAEYQRALEQLSDLGVLYPCFCTRREIQEEIARAGHAPQGPDGPLYPGICRSRPRAEREKLMAEGAAFALRLDVTRALSLVPKSLSWEDLSRGVQTAEPSMFGDVVLARKETPTSYHLAVVVDDAKQGVNLVTRGEDLFEATHVHRLLQELLGLPVPKWHHHRLITDEQGKRLAKRDDAKSLRTLRAEGWKPSDVLLAIGW
jgi:glutamyl-Q tRNA(Asp) synthetase